ncbi:hypothetical protein D9613_009615 [Agrocybe pediades]|uniref:F-box domain-containing protein n=1 Tax=Agrocybe pediades TaxID=84607 RepID=A0A8H4R342_9AGAR|nr:hypothetical protein D9613_009615 [Agrocybe pediades]
MEYPLKTHRVLLIPELLNIIFNHLDLPSNAANARVCRLWSDISLDVLWKEVTKLKRLLQILAPLDVDETGELKFQRLPESADWRRFEKYAKRVRKLTYHSSSRRNLSGSAFDVVARTRTRLDILPNMHTLIWSGPPSFSIIFMHSRVKFFSVALDTNDEFLQPYFHDLVSRMPHLTTLNIQSSIPMRQIEPKMVELLLALPKLQKVVFPRFYFTTKIVETLSTLEQLGTMEFQYDQEQGVGKPEDVQDFTPTLVEGAFPALFDMSTNVRYNDAARFLNLPYAPRNITSLFIDSTDLEHPSAMYDVLSIIAENCKSLKLLALVSLRESFDDDPPDEGMSITLDTIKPAFKLQHLTSLDITHQFPLLLDQKDMETIASTWPSMESILLNPDPVHLSEPDLTLEALLPFAQHCPQLKQLGLYIDATSCSNLATPTVRFKALSLLAMGVSPIADDSPVSLYLSQLLPLGCIVGCGVTWDEADAFRLNLSPRFTLWHTVDDLLPLLIKLRIEERERTKHMEHELDDLRMRTKVISGREQLGAAKDVSTCIVA